MSTDEDGFDRNAISHAVEEDENLDARHAVQLFDDFWYHQVARLGRWMDLIGDYAGEELFIINGESLIEEILDDPLLAIGRADESSFQLLHARYSLERTLRDFRKRNCNFEIVFWHDQRHQSIRTGDSLFVASSRSLARKLLMESLRQLRFHCHFFKDLKDPGWLTFRYNRKPMFLLTNDGGTLSETTDEISCQYTLIKRAFLFDILTSGIAVALYTGLKFINAKIFAFLYEQKYIINARILLPASIWIAELSARSFLDGWSGSNHNHCEIPNAPWMQTAAQQFELSHDQLSLNYDILFLFLIHRELLPSVPLHIRAQPARKLHPELESHLRENFFPVLFMNLERSIVESSSFVEIDLDGRFFLALIDFVISNQILDVSRAVGPDHYGLALEIWHGFGLPAPSLIALQKFAFHYPLPTQAMPSQISVLPFSHPVLDKHLLAVQAPIERNNSSRNHENRYFEFSLMGMPFVDDKHWHNNGTVLPKHLGGETTLHVLDNRRLRKEQQYMRNLQRQTQSLTGALGRPLKTIVIATVGDQPSSAKVNCVSKNAIKGSSSTNAKTRPPSKKEKLLLKIQEDKQSKLDEEDHVWWKEQIRETEGLPIREQESRIDSLFRNPRSEHEWLGLEMKLFALHLIIKEWTECSDNERDRVASRDRYAARVLMAVKEICEKPSVQGNGTVSRIIQNVFSSLGLSCFFGSMKPENPSSASSPSRPLTFKFIKIIKSTTGRPLYDFMSVVGSPVEFQLRAFGPYMNRSMDSKPDTRVQFDPDAWQRKVLDALDANASIFVVAPTSAGKTFIGYYAMEKVLRESDDGILVYVAPTKALVTQIAAEVSVRFHKQVPRGCVWAIHTRDHRIHDPQNCQILITVPEVLGIMLLSPPLATVWTPRIKRVILDEIHSIGQEDSGKVWEQILLMADWPIIGLSATVGSPEKFNTWLSSVQSAHRFDHVFIHWQYRYSHLRKYLYILSNPKETTEFSGLDQQPLTNRLKFLHPAALLDWNTQHIPQDLAFEAADCLTLFQALKKHAPLSTVSHLDPNRFLPHNRFLNQKDIIEYENALKEHLRDMLQTSYSQRGKSVLSSVVQELRTFDVDKDPVLELQPDRIELAKQLIFLLNDLNKTGDLPALVFSFDRWHCEIQAQVLLDNLQKAERTWCTSDPNYQRKLAQWKKWKAGEKSRSRTAERAKTRHKGQDDELPESKETDDRWEARFDPDSPQDQFSFAGRGRAPADLQERLDELRKWTGTEKWALLALERGIAVHHSGMNKRYRDLVESEYPASIICDS